MSEKQTQQHRQHFNLSEEAKQKLEELTARRYPGKQRRQSQLVEDLIAEAFAKELSMNISNSAAPEPSDRLAPASYQALDEAQDKARSMQAREVYPEHLLLVLLEQGYHRTTKALHNLQADNLVKFQNQIITVGTWHDIEERYIRDEVLKAKITGYNKEGLIATVSGCNLTHNFAKRGRYASEGEKGEVMCQITKDFPGAYEQDVSRCD